MCSLYNDVMYVKSIFNFPEKKTKNKTNKKQKVKKT